MTSFYWTTDAEEAIHEQLTIVNMLRLTNSNSLLPDFKSGLAIGSAYEKNTKRAFAAGIFFNNKGRCSATILEEDEEVDFPYVPGLLVFRVGPAICKILDKHADNVDIFIFDSQGIAHERSIGLATHLGILYDKPSIGVTKNNLYGNFVEPPKDRFAFTKIKHPQRNINIGFSIRLGRNNNLCYASPGHNIDLETSIKVICMIAGNSNIPYPIKKAHEMANKNARNYWKIKKDAIMK